MTEQLVIVHVAGVLSLRGSVIEPATTVSSQGLRVRSDTTLFIVNTVDLNGLEVKRGMRINRVSQNVLYEVIIDKNTPTYYNDPNQIELVIPARVICS